MGSFKYVAAGSCYSKYSNLNLYWRPAKNKGFSCKRVNDKTLFVRCPDRDLFILKEPFSNEMIISSDYHLIPLDVFDMRTNNLYGISYFMTNYTKSRKNSNDFVFKNTKKNGNVELLADSGGFQILEGRTDFLDPMDIAVWYEENTHAGMSLDIPNSMVSEKDDSILKRTARIQRMNNELMLSHMRKSELINIVHGSSIKNRLYFHSKVYDSRIHRVAIGGMASLSPSEMVTTILSLFKDQPDYKQYHVLGITRPPALLALAYCSILPMLVTTDSSSHVQTAKSGTYYLHTPKLTQITLNSEISDSNHWVLPCHCPICSAVKYSSVMSKNLSWVTSLYSMHNAFVLNKFCEYAVECAHKGRDAMNYLAKSVISESTKLSNVLAAFDSVDEFAETGTLKGHQGLAKTFPISLGLKKDESDHLTPSRIKMAVTNMENYHENNTRSVQRKDRKRSVK